MFKSLLASILRWIADLLSKPVETTTNPADFVPKLPSDPVTGIADVIAEGEVLVHDQNGPQMIQGRVNAEVQAEKDKIARDEAEALRTGDTTEIDKDLS